MSPRRPQMIPRRAKMSPRRAKVSSGRSREASGSDLGRVSEAFLSNAMRPRRSQLKSPARARSARARLQAGAAARIFSQPSPGSSQTALEKRTRNSRNASAPNARRARAACFLSLPRDRARKLRKKRSRNSRNAPAPNARRARAAREQGLHATHHTRNLDARDALATLASLCLLVLCSGSSRHCLCFSPRVFRRLRCLRLSLLTRFPFLDSQVSLFRCFCSNPLIFQQFQHTPHENHCF